MILNMPTVKRAIQEYLDNCNGHILRVVSVRQVDDNFEVEVIKLIPDPPPFGDGGVEA